MQVILTMLLKLLPVLRLKLLMAETLQRVLTLRLAKVDKLRLEVRSQERTYQLISSLSQHAELQRLSADSRLSLADVKRGDLARRQLERDLTFVEAFLDGAWALRDIMAGSRDRFDGQ